MNQYETDVKDIKNYRQALDGFDDDDWEFDNEFFLEKQALKDKEAVLETIESDEIVDEYLLKNLYHRRVALLLTVQLLYAYDMQTEADIELLQQFLWDKKARKVAKDLAKKMSNDVLIDLQRWDQEIEQYLIGWSWDRVSPVLRAILRAAACELLLQKRPGKIIIHESLEITKFLVDSDRSRKFVNGILDKILQKNTFNENNK